MLFERCAKKNFFVLSKKEYLYMLMQYLYLYDYTGIIWVIDKMKTRWWASQIFRYYHAASSWHFKQGIRHVIADIKKVLFKINYTFIIARQNEWHIFVVSFGNQRQQLIKI